MALRAWPASTLRRSQRNAAASARSAADGTELCAVVKAQASGHGAVPTARAALAGGATRLAVATADEAAELREAGLTAPILIMGAISAEELPVALAAGAELVAWSERFVDDLARAAGDQPADRRPRQARHRHGPAGDARAHGALGARRPAVRQRRARPGAGRRDDAFRDRRLRSRVPRRPASRRLRRSSSVCATVIAATGCSSTPPTAPPRWASRRAISTWCAVESPSTVVTR